MKMFLSYSEQCSGFLRLLLLRLTSNSDLSVHYTAVSKRCGEEKDFSELSSASFHETALTI